MIVDTNCVGALVKRDPSAVAPAREADGSMEPMRLPTAVIWELSCGLGKLADREYSSTLRRKHSSITNGMATAEMDGVVAWRAGELRGKHKASDSLSDLDGADS